MITIKILAFLRKYWIYLLAISSIAVNCWLATRPEKIKTVTEVQTVEKVVTKVETKVQYIERQGEVRRVTVTKAGETRVEEVIRTVERDRNEQLRQEEGRTVEHKTKQSVDSTVARPRTLLGFGYDTSSRAYTLSVQFYPVSTIPVGIGPQVTIVNKKFSFGIAGSLAL